MKKGSVLATTFLALGFLTISFIFLVVERGMGITEPADFFDPAKVAIGMESVAWLVGDLIYLGFAVALGYLALKSEDRYLRASGLAAALAFVFIVGLGRALVQLPALISDSDRLETAMLGLLPVRFAALKTMVLTLGLFAWRTTRGGEPGAASAAWRGLGYLILIASTAFLFVFIPVPLLFTLWAVWFAFRQAREA